ncbi:hypothetical protein EVAR_100425_1 [Eumeta japonica]|uniref:Uncharacterized protein n=1 Tax=Eumeta variegata TaxID=151549 RepID=A0A4C2A809_EUMVA|nr:hypothetical protein EVAR_100425_1 [Eumeta japonica]
MRNLTSAAKAKSLRCCMLTSAAAGEYKIASKWRIRGIEPLSALCRADAARRVRFVPTANLSGPDQPNKRVLDLTRGSSTKLSINVLSVPCRYVESSRMVAMKREKKLCFLTASHLLAVAIGRTEFNFKMYRPQKRLSSGRPVAVQLRFVATSLLMSPSKGGELSWTPPRHR